MSAKKPEQKTRGRPSSFNREQLLEQVMELFWDQGYNNLSFNEIAHATGLTRASLYNAFKTKEALFMEALQQYFDQAPDKSLREELSAGDPVGLTLYGFFKESSAMYGSDKKKRGCLTVNCINELMRKNNSLSEQLLEIYENYKKRLKHVVQIAIDQNELPKDTDPEMTANMILTFMNGFSIFAKSKTSQKNMEKMALDFLQKLGFDIAGSNG